MRRILALALPLLVASTALAQTRDQPNLIFTISGGLTTGGALWSIVQEVPTPQVISPIPLIFKTDTLELGRRLRPGIVASLSATLYRSPHVGYTLEAAYLGLSSEGRCAVQGTYGVDTISANRQACTLTQGEHYPTSVTAFLAGVSFRALPSGRVSPYLTLGGGLGILANSYIETSAVIGCGSNGASCSFALLGDPKRATFTWVASAAVGTSVRFGPGYRLRLEARDLVTALPVATGPGPASTSPPVPQVGRSTHHVFALTAGLEIILERSHRRRY